MINKKIIFLLLCFFININFVNAQEKIAIDIQVEDEGGNWGIGEKMLHYLKDNIRGTNLYRLSSEPLAKFTRIANYSSSFRS